MDEKNINTKSKIINAALQIAAQKGLSKTSLSDIAAAVGIKKASLYNHFTSRDDLILALYAHLRGMAQSGNSISAQLEDLIEQSEPEAVMKTVVDKYIEMCTGEILSQFYRIIESEKFHDDSAAKIMLEETKRMYIQTEALLTCFVKHNKLAIDDMQTAVSVFASAIHDMMIVNILYQRIESSPQEWKSRMDNFIIGFAKLYAPEKI